MKIFEITTNFKPNKITGAEKFCYTISKELSKKHEVIIISPLKQNKLENFRNITLERQSNKILRKLFFDYYNKKNEKKFVKMIKELNPDIIHFHNLYGMGYNLIKASSLLKPTFITVHDYWPIDYNSTMLRSKFDFFKCPLFLFHKIVLKNYLKFAKLITPSKYLMNVLKKKGKFKNVKYIHNGIDVENKKTSYKKNILYVGRISKEKGLSTILPSIRKLLRNSDWKFKILGDGPEKKRLEKKYPEFEWKGFLNPRGYYLSSSILIVPSIWPENLPFVVLEGQNYGLLVIGRKIGGINEMIFDEKTGFKYNTIAEFEKILENILNNKKIIKKIGSVALEDVRKKTVKNTVDLYENLFKENEKESIYTRK